MWGNPNRWFDTSVFELPPQGTFGNTPRSFLRESPLPTAGRILRTVNSAGQIQLGAKVLF